MTPPRPLPCPHKRTRRDTVYEYCEDCGAVRRNVPYEEPEPWHTCELCDTRARAPDGER